MTLSATRTRPTYRITQCLRERRTVDVPGSQIATTVAAWLADLGVRTPLVEDLARAVQNDNWSAARAIGDFLSVDVIVASA